MIGRATDAALLLPVALGGALVVLSIFGSTTAGAPTPPDATLVFLEKRVHDDPLDFTARNRLSARYIGVMRESGNLEYLDRAAEEARASLEAVSAPRNPGGLFALALARFESHHFAEALEMAQKAFAIDPRNTAALALAGDANLELGNYDEAEQIYRRLETDGPSASVLARQARLAELRGDNAHAIELLGQASALDGKDGWYRIRRGEILFRTGRVEEAEAEYLAAPESFAQQDHLAELRASQGRDDEAVAIYERLAARTGRAEILQDLGDLYAMRGKRDLALVWWERARDAYLASARSGNAHYYHHLAAYYSDCEKNPAEALRWARKDLEVRHSIYAHDAYAWALYQNGEFANAAEEMRKATALGTRDAHLLFHAGLVFWRAGELERGRAALEQVALVDPAYDSFHVHR